MSYVERRAERGATLVELLVVLAIVSILAVTAIPFAETASQRRKEIALQETLRSVRTAIDRFHADWTEGWMEEDEEIVSEHGYPADLSVLVRGVDLTIDDETVRRRYLRRMPRNPFVPGDAPQERHWRFISYEGGPEAAAWDGSDVWDLRAVTDREALDGTRLSDW